MHASPFTEYTAGVVMYILLVATLVIVLLGGAFLVLNLGLLSKREEDRTGHRDPSDVGVLKDRVWPEEMTSTPVLPAEESEEELEREMSRIQERLRKKKVRRAS